MKKLTFTFFFLCMAFVYAQNVTKPTVVVVPFDTNGVPQEDVDIVNELFISEYANTGRATVVDRNSFDKIQEQLNFQTTDWSDSQKVAELGKALNAQQVVVGQFTKREEQIIFIVRVLDVNTVAILSSKSVFVKDITELFSSLYGICDEISAKVVGDSVKTSSESITKSNILQKTKETNDSEEFIPEYGIGDRGPGGGIIFYVSRKGFKVYYGTEIQICHYLEMANDVIKDVSFYPNDIRYDFETKYGVGYGKENTWKICNRKDTYLTEQNCAAYACQQYHTSSTKKGDWFLPASEEIYVLARSLVVIDVDVFSKDVIDSIKTSLFWTSYCFNDKTARYRWFRPSEGGSIYWLKSDSPSDYSNTNKSRLLNVIPIRAF